MTGTTEQPSKCSSAANGKNTPVIEPETRAEKNKGVDQLFEQPNQDNPGPIENLIVAKIEHDLENIVANLEMLKHENPQQRRSKCVLTLEIARIRGEGGIFDDLKGAFE